MAGPLHFAPLGSDDAPLIGALQRRLFPAALTEIDAYLAGILRNTEQHLVCNLSFGLFEGRSLVGYVFAYVESKSLFHARAEEVVYLKEFALLPGYEAQLRPMFTHLFLQWQAFTPGLAMEAHAVAEALQKWRRLERAFRLYGLTLRSREEAARPDRAAYWLMRFDVDADTRQLLERPAALPAATMQSEGFDCCVVTTVPQWLGLKQDWERLRRPIGLAGGAAPFDYLQQWWRHLGIWKQLHVVVMRQQGEVVAIAPLMIETLRDGASVLRRMRPIASGGDGWNPVALVAADPQRAAVALVAVLAAEAQAWDVVELPGQRDRHDPHASHGQREPAEQQGLPWWHCLLTLSRARGWQAGRSADPAPWATLSDASTPAGRAPSGNAPGEDAWRIRCVLPQELVAALDAHCEVEEEGGYPAPDLPLGDDRGLLYLMHRLAAGAPSEGWQLVQHVAEVSGRIVASRFGLLDGTDFLVLRVAHRGTAQALRAAPAIEAAERETLRDRGVRRVQYATGHPTHGARREPATRVRIWQSAQASWARRQWRREQLAALVDALSIGGAGRGLARRLRRS